MKPIVKLVNLGRMNYADALRIQLDTSRRILDTLNSSSSPDSRFTKNNTLILVEHEPVYTVGIRDKNYDTATEKKLRSLGADFVRTNRGGLITFHGPGQLVAYPILYLGDFDAKRSVKWFVHQMEKTVISCCTNVLFPISNVVQKNGSNHLDISTLDEHPGVWINGQRKVAALGIRASRYVTMHGLAINCDVDIGAWFSHITPCGIEDKEVTSLELERIKLTGLNSRKCTLEQVTPIFVEAFKKHFNCELD